ncbi:MAG: hypothetical protein JJU13_02895 [Balneolaceae bacterium]|nr:hypothetical protein [Balneolaceae bacterium]
MSRLNLFISACLLSLILASCTAITTEDLSFTADEGGMLHTDAEIYEAEIFQDDRQGVRFNIPYTVTNTSEKAVYMIGCRQPSAPVLQKSTGEEWVSAFSPVEQLCLSPPFILEPGEQRGDTLQVYGFFPGQNTYPEFLTDIEGTYRLKKRIYSDPKTFDDPGGWNNHILDQDLRISNTFQVIEK